MNQKIGRLWHSRIGRAVMVGVMAVGIVAGSATAAYAYVNHSACSVTWSDTDGLPSWGWWNGTTQSYHWGAFGTCSGHSVWVTSYGTILYHGAVDYRVRYLNSYDHTSRVTPWNAVGYGQMAKLDGMAGVGEHFLIECRDHNLYNNGPHDWCLWHGSFP